MENLYIVDFKGDKEQEKKKRRKLRWDRVFIALGILFCIVYTVISLTVKSINYIPELIDKQDQVFLENVLDKYDTVEVTMHYGETVWEKQQELIPSSSYNMYDILYVLSYLNGGYDNWHTVKTGDQFIFLTEKTMEEQNQPEDIFAGKVVNR